MEWLPEYRETKEAKPPGTKLKVSSLGWIDTAMHSTIPLNQCNHKVMRSYEGVAYPISNLHDPRSTKGILVLSTWTALEPVCSLDSRRLQAMDTISR